MRTDIRGLSRGTWRRGSRCHADGAGCGRWRKLRTRPSPELPLLVGTATAAIIELRNRSLEGRDRWWPECPVCGLPCVCLTICLIWRERESITECRNNELIPYYYLLLTVRQIRQKRKFFRKYFLELSLRCLICCLTHVSRQDSLAKEGTHLDAAGHRNAAGSAPPLAGVLGAAQCGTVPNAYPEGAVLEPRRVQ